MSFTFEFGLNDRHDNNNGDDGEDVNADDKSGVYQRERPIKTFLCHNFFSQTYSRDIMIVNNRH